MFYLLIVLSVLIVMWLCLEKKDLGPPDLSGKLPIIGHAHQFLGSSIYMYKSFRKISHEALDKDGVVKANLGPLKLFIIADPEDFRTLAEACLHKHNSYDIAKPFLGNGLVSAEVPIWKKNRKLFNPAFNQGVLNNQLDYLNGQAKKMVNHFADSLGKRCDQEKIIRKITLETICMTATGVSLDDNNLLKEYQSYFMVICGSVNERFTKFWLHNDTIFKWSSLKKKQDKAIKQIRALTDLIIQEKKSATCKPTFPDNKSGYVIIPFIDYILKYENDTFCEDEHIRSEINTFIAAGYDTNSTALTLALTLLGSHEKVQAKAYDEIIEVLGTSGRVGKEDLSKLVYIEAILKETLRLYPPIPIIGRQLQKDLKLRNYTLKANSGCLVSIYGALRHRMWGTDANEFRPERWFQKETLPDPKYFAAFSFGQRACIGKTYAMITMKVFLVYILRRYHISSDVSKMVLEMKTVLNPKSGFHISLEHRNV